MFFIVFGVLFTKGGLKLLMSKQEFSSFCFTCQVTDRFMDLVPVWYSIQYRYWMQLHLWAHLFFRGSRFILTHPKFGRILPGKLPHCNTFAISICLLYTPGMLADTWGRYNIMIVTAIMCSVLTFASIAARNTPSILVVGGMCIGNRHKCGSWQPHPWPWKALYGFASGNVLSLQGACIPPLLVRTLYHLVIVNFNTMLLVRTIQEKLV